MQAFGTSAQFASPSIVTFRSKMLRADLLTTIDNLVDRKFRVYSTTSGRPSRLGPPSAARSRRQRARGRSRRPAMLRRRAEPRRRSFGRARGRRASVFGAARFPFRRRPPEHALRSRSGPRPLLRIHRPACRNSGLPTSAAPEGPTPSLDPAPDGTDARARTDDLSRTDDLVSVSAVPYGVPPSGMASFFRSRADTLGPRVLEMCAPTLPGPR